MTIADKLALLEQTKEAQRVKLGLPKSLPFSRYHEFFQFKFVPSYLFLNGEQGVWFDPSDLKTMYQDVNGLTPVTKDGDPVALIKDKSGNGNHATQPTASARPIYRTDGNLHWLEFDGIDDSIYADINGAVTTTTKWAAAVDMLKSSGFIASCYDSTNSRFILNRWGGGYYAGYYDGTQYYTKGKIIESSLVVLEANYDIGSKDVSLAVNNSEVFDSTNLSSGASVYKRLYIGKRGQEANFAEMKMYGLIRVDSVSTKKNPDLHKYLANKAGLPL